MNLTTRFRSKKGITAFVLTAMLLLISACGSNGGEVGNKNAPAMSNGPSASPGSSPASKGPVTITFSTFNAWWTAGNFEKVVKMYEQKTGNKVDAQIFPDDQFFNVIRTKLASGEPPDVFAIWPDINNFNTDQLEPFTGAWTSKIDMEHAKKVGYASIKDGKLYTAPYGGQSLQGLMYNKEVFAKAGIATPLKSYKEFLDAAEKFKSMGITPLIVPAKDDWTTQIVFYAGSNFLSASDPNFAPDIASNKAKLADKPALVDMMKRVVALKDKGYTNSDFLSTTMTMAEEALANGKTAMVFGGDWLYPDFVNNYSDKTNKIGMTAISWGDDPTLVGITKGASGNGLFVPKQAKNKQAAMEFADYVMSEEAIKALYELSPGVNELGYDAKVGPWQQEMLGLVKSGAARDIPNMVNAIQQAFPGSGMTLGPIAQSFSSAFSSGNVSRALEDWFTEYKKQNKAKQVPGF